MKIGNRVKFLSDTGVGFVTKIEGNTAYVDVIDGFEIPTDIGDLVVVNEEDELEAIGRIGLSDEKPGRRGKQAAKGEKEVLAAPQREPSFRKYGKVSLMEDDDDTLDVFELRERYRKSQEICRQREAEMEKAEAHHAAQKAFVTEESRVLEKKEEDADAVIDTPQEKASEEIKPAVKEKAENIRSAAKNDEIEVIDLHADEILSTTEGLSSGEILTAQLARYTFTLDGLAASKKHGKIVFIHGVGKGKLKYEMLKILREQYKKMDYQDASFKEYGYGAIIVYY